MKKVKTKDLLKDLPPLSDGRMKRLVGAMRKRQYEPDAVIEILHVAQDIFGYVPLNIMAFIAREMKTPPSRIFGVVTFYHFFSLKPKGDHTCLVCTGTACHVKGSQGILDAMEKTFALKPGEATADNRLGLQTARCLGCCSLAPVVVLDGEILGDVKAEAITELVQKKTEGQG